jgi:hypothetical protein
MPIALRLLHFGLNECTQTGDQLTTRPNTLAPLLFSSNGTFFVKSGELDAANKAATASLTAAITAVNANIYTTTQAEGPTPVPGAGKYTAANLYGSITLSSTAGQQNQITAASNTSYAGKTMLTVST